MDPRIEVGDTSSPGRGSEQQIRNEGVSDAYEAPWDWSCDHVTRRLLLALAIAASLSVMSGCAHAATGSVTSSGPDATAPGPEEPTASAGPSVRQPADTNADGKVSSRESLAWLAACLQELGWDVVLDGDSVHGRNMGAQYDAYIRDTEECIAKGAPNVPQSMEWTPELARVEYDAQVEYRECLIEHGVDAPELPSYQQYEDDMLIRGEPYDGSEAAGLPYGSELRLTCADPFETFGQNG